MSPRTHMSIYTPLAVLPLTPGHTNSTHFHTSLPIPPPFTPRCRHGPYILRKLPYLCGRLPCVRWHAAGQASHGGLPDVVWYAGYWGGVGTVRAHYAGPHTTRYDPIYHIYIYSFRYAYVVYCVENRIRNKFHPHEISTQLYSYQVPFCSWVYYSVPWWGWGPLLWTLQARR